MPGAGRSPGNLCQVQGAALGTLPHDPGGRAWRHPPHRPVAATATNPRHEFQRHSPRLRGTMLTAFGRDRSRPTTATAVSRPSKSLSRENCQPSPTSPALSVRAATQTPKSEARNPKSETNPNLQNPNHQNSPPSRSDDLCQPRGGALGTYARCAAGNLCQGPGDHATRPRRSRMAASTTSVRGRDRNQPAAEFQRHSPRLRGTMLTAFGRDTIPSYDCRRRVPSIQESVPGELPTVTNFPRSLGEGGHPRRPNPKHEIRNPKQIQIFKIQITKTARRREATTYASPGQSPGDLCQCRAEPWGPCHTTPAVAHGGIHHIGPWPRPQPTRGRIPTTLATSPWDDANRIWTGYDPVLRLPPPCPVHPRVCPGRTANRHQLPPLSR